MSFLLGKLRDPYIWSRILVERLTEPLHLNVLAAFIWPIGGFRLKVAWDLVVRHQHAFGLLQAADFAKTVGVTSLTAVELGVGNGVGLLNLCEVAARVTRETGVRFDIVGVDSGRGMPPPRDYRDHPEYYTTGDYPMNVEALRSRLPRNARLLIGELSETIPQVAGSLSPAAPLGFASVDLDYYWSTRDALQLFTGEPTSYLPITLVYVDDIGFPGHNPWCGEWLAINEFNSANELRKVTNYNMLREARIFKHAQWIARMHALHVLDHPARTTIQARAEPATLPNPYFS